jgi:hypothetical protein
VARSEGLLDARGCVDLARLPAAGRPVHLIGYDAGRDRLLLVAAVAWGRRLPTLLRLLGDRRLKRLCGSGLVEVQVHAWRTGATGRLRADVLVLGRADYFGRARGPARGRWGGALAPPGLS